MPPSAFHALVQEVAGLEAEVDEAQRSEVAAAARARRAREDADRAARAVERLADRLKATRAALALVQERDGISAEVLQRVRAAL